MKSPYHWYGGKGKLVRQLQTIAPTNYSAYAELYFGGGSLFLSMPPVEREIVNDLDIGVAHFWRVFQSPDLFPKFHYKARNTPHSRFLYYECLRTWMTEPDDVERAWKWWVVARYSFGGKFGAAWSFAVHAKSIPVRATINTVERFKKIHSRLHAGVTIKNESALNLLHVGFSEGTWVFCDPPYVHDTRTSRNDYAVEATDTHHKILVSLLLSSTNMIALSGYKHLVYAPLERAGWRRIDWKCMTSSAAVSFYNRRTGRREQQKMRPPRTESCWINYDPKTSKLIV